MLKPYDGVQSAPQTAAESSSLPVLMSKKPSPPRKPKVTKLFVLDTNVLMHDPSSLFRFDEHDVYLPIGRLRVRGIDRQRRNGGAADREEGASVHGSPL